MTTDIQTLTAEAARKAAEAAAAEQAVQAAWAEADAALDKRERQYERQLIKSFDPKAKQTAEAKAFADFEKAVARGENGGSQWIQFRTLRALRMAETQAVAGAAQHLGESVQVPTISSGSENYAAAYQSALDRAVADKVAETLDALDEERRRFIEG